VVIKKIFEICDDEYAYSIAEIMKENLEYKEIIDRQFVFKAFLLEFQNINLNNQNSVK